MTPTILKDVLALGGAVVGGYARDTALGGIPKDIDVALYGNWRAVALHDLTAALVGLGYTVTTEHSDDPDYNGAEAGLYDCIVQLEREGSPDIDLLVFAEQYGTLADCLATFDYNLNQWYLDQLGVPRWAGRNWGILTASEKPRTAERALKMQTKAAAYGWLV